MFTQPLEQYNIPTRILKRAQYEALEFELLDNDVRVRNASHACPRDHEYVVTIDDDLPVECSCPAVECFTHPCKHRAAIAIRPAIISVVNDVREVTEGGVVKGYPVTTPR